MGVGFHGDVCLHYCCQLGRQRSKVSLGCMFTLLLSVRTATLLLSVRTAEE